MKINLWIFDNVEGATNALNGVQNEAVTYSQKKNTFFNRKLHTQSLRERGEEESAQQYHKLKCFFCGFPFLYKNTLFAAFFIHAINLVREFRRGAREKNESFEEELRRIFLAKTGINLFLHHIVFTLFPFI